MARRRFTPTAARFSSPFSTAARADVEVRADRFEEEAALTDEEWIEQERRKLFDLDSPASDDLPFTNR